jgi:hypothetical protein
MKPLEFVGLKGAIPSRLEGGFLSGFLWKTLLRTVVIWRMLKDGCRVVSYIRRMLCMKQYEYLNQARFFKPGFSMRKTIQGRYKIEVKRREDGGREG